LQTKMWLRQNKSREKNDFMKAFVKHLKDTIHDTFKKNTASKVDTKQLTTIRPMGEDHQPNVVGEIFITNIKQAQYTLVN